MKQTNEPVNRVLGSSEILLADLTKLALFGHDLEFIYLEHCEIVSRHGKMSKASQLSH